MSLRILVHNVGHGLAVHLFTPNEQTIVVDLGASADHSPLAWLHQQTNEIDLLVVTHPHGDHISEINLVQNFSVRQFHRPKWLTRDEILAANQASYAPTIDTYLSLSDGFPEPILDHDRVGNPSVSGGVSLSVFYSSACDRTNINNHSAVLVVEYLGVRVVVPGDNEAESWQELLHNPEFVQATQGAAVFVASHHGRQNGFSEPLFDLITPQICIVSDGRVQSTDARARYAAHASGWPVVHRSTGAVENRHCVTTRSDGWIDVKIGAGGPPLLPLSIVCA